MSKLKRKISGLERRRSQGARPLPNAYLELELPPESCCVHRWLLTLRAPLVKVDKLKII